MTFGMFFMKSIFIDFEFVLGEGSAAEAGSLKLQNLKNLQKILIQSHHAATP